MKKVILDLPQRNELMVLDADQWMTLETWLGAEGIEYTKQTPDNPETPADEETLISYRIKSDPDQVEAFLKENRISGESRHQEAKS